MNVVCAGVPTNRELAVFAEFMPEGDNETRWRRIYLEVEPGREIASSERIGRTGVDYARLMFVDADALGAWGSGESLASLRRRNRNSNRDGLLAPFKSLEVDARSMALAT